jgi:hypothetical protein
MTLKATALAAALLATLLAGAAAARPASQDQIGVSRSVWAITQTDWTVAADGSVVLREFVNGPGRMGPTFVKVRRLPPGPGRWEQVQALLQAVEPYGDHEPACRKVMYDGPFLEISWLRGGVAHALRRDTGCVSYETAGIDNQIGAVTELIRFWTAGVAPNEEPGVRDPAATRTFPPELTQRVLKPLRIIPLAAACPGDTPASTRESPPRKCPN